MEMGNGLLGVEKHPEMAYAFRTFRAEQGLFQIFSHGYRPCPSIAIQKLLKRIKRVKLEEASYWVEKYHPSLAVAP